MSQERSQMFLMISLGLCSQLAAATPAIDDARASSCEEQVPSTSAVRCLGGSADDEDEHPPKPLDRVIVSATRVPQPLHRLPPSVFVLDGGELDEHHPSDFADFAHRIPGMAFAQSGFGGAQPIPILRGISQNIEFAESNPLVAVYFGETPVTQPGGVGIGYNPRIESYDLERIEVLRGPQGTYFGIGAMSGALRYLPRRAQIGVNNGRVDFDVGYTEHGGPSFAAHALVNAGLDDRAALRGLAWRRDRDGWIDDLARHEADVNGSDSTGLRLSAHFAPGERLVADFTLSSQRERVDGFNLDEYDEPELEQSREIDEHTSDDWSLAQLDLAYRGDQWLLSANLAAFDRDYVQDTDVSTFMHAVFGLDNTLTARNDNRIREYTQELRLSSDPDASVGAMVGLYNQQRDFHFDQDFPSPGLLAALPDFAVFGLGDNLHRARSLNEVRQRAVYANGWWRPADDWEISAGLRWFEEDRELNSVSLGALGISDFELQADDDGVMPQLSIRHDLSDDVSLHALASRGFRSGGLNDATGSDLPACVEELAALGRETFPTEFGTDNLWNYELGTRLRWNDGRTTLNASVFRIDWRDVQTLRVLECVGLPMTTNEGRARSVGLELDLHAEIGEHWQWNLAANYTDASFTDGLFEGSRMPAVPRLSASAAVAFHFSNPSNRIELRYTQVGRSNQALNGGYGTEIGGYGLAGIGAWWDFGRWQGMARIDNLFDRRGRVGAANHFLLAAETLIAPRTLSIGVTVPF